MRSGERWLEWIRETAGEPGRAWFNSDEQRIAWKEKWPSPAIGLLHAACANVNEAKERMSGSNQRLARARDEYERVLSEARACEADLAAAQRELEFVMSICDDDKRLK